MLLYRGSRGPKVEWLQGILKQLGYPIVVDGIFGPQTTKFVKQFQREAGLDVDGIVGSKTIEVLRKRAKNYVPPPEGKIVFKEVPKYKDLFTIFGDFRIPSWKSEYLVRCDLSHVESFFDHVVLGWDNSVLAFKHSKYFGFYCHKYVVDKFQLVFEEIARRRLHTKIITFDGCFSIRFMRRAKKWSTHSWAIAIDLNAKWNRFGQRNFNMSPEIVDIFSKYGFVWGGKWRTPDAMHFQFCK